MLFRQPEILIRALELPEESMPIRAGHEAPAQAVVVFWSDQVERVVAQPEDLRCDSLERADEVRRSAELRAVVLGRHLAELGRVPAKMTDPSPVELERILRLRPAPHRQSENLRDLGDLSCNGQVTFAEGRLCRLYPGVRFTQGPCRSPFCVLRNRRHPRCRSGGRPRR